MRRKTGISIDQLTKSIQEAAKAGDLKGIKKIHRGGSKHQWEFFRGLTAEKKLLRGGHKEVVAFLVEKGASVKVQDKDGLTPLQLAVKGGNKEIISILETELNKTEKLVRKLQTASMREW